MEPRPNEVWGPVVEVLVLALVLAGWPALFGEEEADRDAKMRPFLDIAGEVAALSLLLALQGAREYS